MIKDFKIVIIFGFSDCKVFLPNLFLIDNNSLIITKFSLKVCFKITYIYSIFIIHHKILFYIKTHNETIVN